MASLTTAKGVDDQAATADAKPGPISRDVYIVLRLKELNMIIHDHAVEREVLNGTLRNRADEKGGEVRTLRYRRGYLAVRLALLREEQRSLLAEKEAMSSEKPHPQPT